MINCPRCGRTLDKCPTCGQIVDESRISSIKCFYCGENITVKTTQPAQPSYQPYQPAYQPYQPYPPAYPQYQQPPQQMSKCSRCGSTNLQFFGNGKGICNVCKHVFKWSRDAYGRTIVTG
ncbi:MAG: hypothetical protein QMC80_07245 [Thermoplasmatales archaeon]|nr:hypothetical protein [Thermoplasmatales archaeon]